MDYKIGDKVKMSKYGLQFYSNVSHMIDSHRVPLANSVKVESVESLVCELMSIHGVGTIIKLTEENALIRFRNSTNGVFFYYKGIYDYESFYKLSLFERIVLRFKELL